MIKVFINDIEYKIKTSWSDVEPMDLYNLKSVKPKDQLFVLSDMPYELIEQFDNKALFPLVSLISFLDDFPEFEPIEREINIGKEAWRKLELLKQAHKSLSIPHISFEACRLYFGEDVLNWSVSKIYSQSNQILHSYSLFLERFKELNEDNPYDDDQLEAGVKAFETFGAFGILYSLAGGDPTKYKEINEMDAESIYFTLLFEKAKNDYNDKLKKIYERQNGITASKSS